VPYLVDGSNLIGSFAGLRRDRPGDRGKLVRALLAAPAARHKGVTVVFDGPPDSGGSRLSLGRGTEVRYSGERADADSVIRRLLDRAESNYYVLVTDDRELREHARIRGAASLSCGEFLRRLAPPAAGKEGREVKRPDTPLSSVEVEEWLGWFGRKDGD